MYKDIYEKWMNSERLLPEEREELQNLKNEEDIEYRFGKNLEFGTAGMRGIIGLGTNMMNNYTVSLATQGLAEYIKDLGQTAIKRGVVLSYDTRQKSREFAYASAIVLASNGIKTYVFGEYHPVPMLSFAVRKLNCIAGIMITASHNPKEYNGFKVYGEDGAQMSPEATAVVVDYINRIGDCLSDKILYDERFEKKIKVIGKRIDSKYYATIKKLALSNEESKIYGKNIKLVYTPLHGSGNVPVRTILKKVGISPILVPEQLSADPAFPTVEVPNPENKEALTLAIKKADFEGADVVFGTDPDCDRLGVAVRNNLGEFQALSGNQTGILLLDYILMRLKQTGRLSNRGFAVKSFVTTSMAKLIADDYGVELFETPVGFKFIGEKIKQLDDTGKRQFIFGFEESCGYLRGTHARDKDAVVSSMIFAEMVCYYTSKGIRIYDKLQDLYNTYGYVFDTNVSTKYSGLNAMDEMNAVVDKVKTLSIDKLGGVKVNATRDYSSLVKTLADGTKEQIESFANNAVYYELEGGSFVCLRPSGTEPKLKVYYSVKGENEEKAIKTFEKIKKDFEKLLK